MMPARPRLHLDPDHGPGHQRSRSPAREENQRLTGWIAEPQKLKERGDQSQTAGGGDRSRTITAKCSASGNLAANCEDVGQSLVEIAHLTSALRCKVYTTAK